MLPSVNDLVRNHENCYSFVAAIAKRARHISEKANDESIMLDEKPVKIAIKEYENGKFTVLPPKIMEENQKTDVSNDNQVVM